MSEKEGLQNVYDPPGKAGDNRSDGEGNPAKDVLTYRASLNLPEGPAAIALCERIDCRPALTSLWVLR